MRFAEFAEQTLIQRTEEGIRGVERERSRYRVDLENAAFAHMQLAEIRPRDIREWYRATSRRNCQSGDTSKKVSRHTVARSAALLSAIFASAVERELIEINPCVGTRPKRRADEDDTKDPWTWLTVVEQIALTTCPLISDSDRRAIRFAISTGLRQGEQFNLEIIDVDIGDNDPHVLVRYGSRPRNGKKMPPKSGKKRKVPLFGDGLSVAREQLAALEGQPNPHGLMFPSPTGCRRQQSKPLGKSGTFKKHLHTAGITRRVRWHDLRHTFASNLVTGSVGTKRRWSLEELRPVMGHSSITITQRYAHIGEDAVKRAVRETEAEAPKLEAANDTTRPAFVEEGPERAASWLDRVRNAARKVLSNVA